MQELGEVIGAGGYGVARELKNSPYVVKLMREKVCRSDARKEFDAHTQIFKTYQKIINKNPELKDVLYVPKPIEFRECEPPYMCYGEPQSACAYVMENVESARPDKIQEHLILNEDSKGHTGYIWCNKESKIIKYNATDILDVEQKADCQPRGAFIGPENIKPRIDSRLYEKLPYLFGILHGIVIEAGYFPIDVELVIDKNNRIAMYDFGMVYDKTLKEYETSLNIDMYIPSADQKEEYDEFKRGVAFVHENLLSGGGRRKTRRKSKKSRKTARK